MLQESKSHVETLKQANGKTTDIQRMLLFEFAPKASAETVGQVTLQLVKCLY